MVRNNRFSAAFGWCRAVSLGATVLLLGEVGCFSHYRSSYSMENVQAKPVSLMVAEKIQRPLYLVLDPARVPDAWDMKEASSLNPQNGAQFKLLDFQRFVTRDLKNALGNYFTSVEVIKPGDPLPTDRYVVGDVKVDRIQLHSVPAGGMTYTIIEMTWGLGLRLSESKEYNFTFAGEGHSSEAYPTFEAGCAQLVESAIAAFTKGMIEKGGFEAIHQVTVADKLTRPRTAEASKPAEVVPFEAEKAPPAATTTAPASSSSPGKKSRK